MQETYVLLSDLDARFYTGTAGDVRRRIDQHRSARIRSTAHRRPLRLVSDAACISAGDAYRRERYRKTGRGGRYLRQRLASSPSRIRGNKLERY